MELHQLLRVLDENIPIILFDLNGNKLFATATKKAIHVDFYEYRIYEIKFGNYISNEFWNSIQTGLYITLEK